jgi:hypothetical protein
MRKNFVFIQVTYMARMRMTKCACGILAGKSLGKRPFRRPKLGWDNNTEMYVREVSSEDDRLLELRYFRLQFQGYVVSNI